LSFSATGYYSLITGSKYPAIFPWDHSFIKFYFYKRGKYQMKANFNVKVSFRISVEFGINNIYLKFLIL